MSVIPTLRGLSFQTNAGLRFRVIKDRFFPRGKHDQQNGAYLDSLREDQLVSVLYHSVPVPLIILNNGVVKLELVEVKGKRVKGAGKISNELGVSQPRVPVAFA